METGALPGLLKRAGCSLTGVDGEVAVGMGEGEGGGRHCEGTAGGSGSRGANVMNPLCMISAIVSMSFSCSGVSSERFL